MLKKITLITLLLFALVAKAQNAPIDFEPYGFGAFWTWTVFENASNPALEIVPNPAMSQLNPSGHVAKFTALQAGAPFAGCESQHGADIGTFTLNEFTSTIKIKVWKSTISDVGIKLVESTSASLGEIKVANTLINEWEELSFDFSDMEGIAYDQIVIFPDFIERTADNIIYFDDITFVGQTVLALPTEAAPSPTIAEANVISMFSNIYTNVPVDTWQTPWSSAGLNDVQIAGDDTKQYTNLDFVGIETVGPNLIDATDMHYFHVDMWTPNMTEFKIKLVDFGADGNYAGGDDSEHELVFENPAQNTWVTYELPLADFTGLTSRAHLAQLIFSGAPVGGGVVYIDNVYFSNQAVGIADTELFTFKLYPNPVTETLQIEGLSSVESLHVYNLLGKKVMAAQVSGNRSTVDVAHLDKGVYFLKMLVNGVSVSKRFVKD